MLGFGDFEKTPFQTLDLFDIRASTFQLEKVPELVKAFDSPLSFSPFKHICKLHTS